MSRYHAASVLLAKKKKSEGLLKYYNREILEVFEPLLNNLLKAAALMTHRIIEESRLAKLKDGIKHRAGIYMTESPHTADPDSDEPHELKHYTAKELRGINTEIKRREGKLSGMKEGLTKLGQTVEGALPWLEDAMEKYAELAERMAKIRNNRERRKLDRGLEDKAFLVGRKKIVPEGKTTFKNRPEWDDFSLTQRLNIYRHSSGKGEGLKPLKLLEHRNVAEALNLHAAELRGYLADAKKWVRCKIDKEAVDEGGKPILDKGGKPVLSPSPLEFEKLEATIRGTFAALKAGMEAEKDLLKELDETIPLRRVGVKKRRPKLHVDWANYFKDVKEKPFSARVKSKQKRYKRDRLGRFAK